MRRRSEWNSRLNEWYTPSAMTIATPRTPATIADLLAIPEDERFHEIIDGELVQKSAPSGEHGDAQSAVVALLKPRFQRRPSHSEPGGWWIFTEVEVRFAADQIFRPDITGWRRERVPLRPTGSPIDVRPDWVCEIVSPTKPARDLVAKKRTYHRVGVPHYWIVDPRDETLTVHRWSADGYIQVLLAQRGERVHAEPFDAVEIVVGTLFGDDPED